MNDPYRLESCPACPPFWVATRTFTVECPRGKVGQTVSVTRQYKSTYGMDHANAVALQLAEREARGLLNCSEPVLAPFDFAVLRYIWDEAGGRDLDTRTAVVSPARNFDVGWTRRAADPLEAILAACSVNAAIDGQGPFYIAHGGDNCSQGVEAVLIDFAKISADYPGVEAIDIRLRAFWYSLRSSGDISLQFQTYMGGTMARSGYDFVNAGGVAVQTISTAANVTLQTSSDSDGEDLGTLRYNSADKTASLIPA